MTLTELVDKFMLKKMKEEDYSGIITYLLTMLLHNFTRFLEVKEGITDMDKVTDRHIDRYYDEYLACYQEYLHETMWEFFTFLKKQRGEL